MFCNNCGNEVQDEWKVCPRCGMNLKQSEDKTKVENDRIHKEKGSKKKWVILSIILLLFFGVAIIGISTHSKQQKSVIDKLQKFTTTYKDESKCYFANDDEAWILIYGSENEVVNFKNDAVMQCFKDLFGNNCYAEDSVSSLGFAFDLSDNRALLFLDVDTDEGHLAIIEYSFEDNEYRAMVDGEWWDVTDEFNEFVEERGLVSAMETDISQFKSVLKKNGLTVSDLLKIEYEDLDKQSFGERKLLPADDNKETDPKTEREGDNKETNLKTENADDDKEIDPKTESEEPSMDENKMVGKYIADNGSSLTICKTNDDYMIAIDIVRLTSINNGLSISVSEKEMIFTATDASGNPIGGKLEWSNNYSDLKYTVIESTWDYLPNGTEIVFQKSCDNEVHEINEQWYIEHNIFSSMQSDAMLEIECQSDVILYVTVYYGEESISHLFDVSPNETGDYDELIYFSDDGSSIIYYPGTQSVFYENGEGLWCGMYY